jgi:hypothetical protein
MPPLSLAQITVFLSIAPHNTARHNTHTHTHTTVLAQYWSQEMHRERPRLRKRQLPMGPIFTVCSFRCNLVCARCVRQQRERVLRPEKQPERDCAHESVCGVHAVQHGGIVGDHVHTNSSRLVDGHSSLPSRVRTHAMHTHTHTHTHTHIIHIHYHHHHPTITTTGTLKMAAVFLLISQQRVLTSRQGRVSFGISLFGRRLCLEGESE